MECYRKSVAERVHDLYFNECILLDDYIFLQCFIHLMMIFFRLKEHVAVKNNLPILIFPEGTCINNTSIMMFKKGSFEVGATIYPIAIKVRQ